MYYHVYSATMSPCALADDERERAYDTWLCKACNGPKLGCGAVDIRLDEGEILTTPMTFIAGGFPGIVWKEFLAAISPAVLRRDLLFGIVRRFQGQVVEQWATFHGRYRLIVRGTTNVTERECGECGQLVYFGMGSRFLYPAPPDDAELYESDLCGLIFSESQFHSLDIARWAKRLHIDELRVSNDAVTYEPQ